MSPKKKPGQVLIVGPNGGLTETKESKEAAKAAKKAARQAKKREQYLEVRLDPANDHLPVTARAKLAKCSRRYATTLEKDPEFMDIVRRTRFMTKSKSLMVIDDALFKDATEGENRQAGTKAAEILYKKWDPDYGEKVRAEVGISFVDLIRQHQNGQ